MEYDGTMLKIDVIRWPDIKTDAKYVRSLKYKTIALYMV